jgi:hypothetical protein
MCEWQHYLLCLCGDPAHPLAMTVSQGDVVMVRADRDKYLLCLCWAAALLYPDWGTGFW